MLTVIGRLSDKHGSRWFGTGGFVLAVPALVLMRLVTSNTIGHKVLLCALLAMVGFSLTLVMPPLMAEIQHVVEATEKKQPGLFGEPGATAQAYGLFTLSYAGGIMIGPLWGGFIEAHAGWKTLTWTLGLLCGVTAVLAVSWVPRPLQADA